MNHNYYDLAIGMGLGMLAEALTAIYAKHRIARRDAHELIESARRGTDLLASHTTTSALRHPAIPHWSDLCAACHHDRSKHHLGYGICLHIRAQMSDITEVCNCLGFEHRQ